MAKNTVRMTFEGLEELKAGLRTLPDRLTREAGRIVLSAANAAAVEVRSAYGPHRHTGKLQDSVLVEPLKGPGVRYQVRARARHAHLFEFGTQGGRRSGHRPYVHGRMPAANLFIPTMTRWRIRMYEELKALLVREGLLMTGEAKAA